MNDGVGAGCGTEIRNFHWDITFHFLIRIQFGTLAYNRFHFEIPERRTSETFYYSIRGEFCSFISVFYSSLYIFHNRNTHTDISPKIFIFSKFLIPYDNILQLKSNTEKGFYFKMISFFFLWIQAKNY